MVKKQRGKASSSSRTARSEEMTDHFSMALDSSDDEAPEEVTFEDSKDSALRTMKQALERARREKELLKEKRRKRQELFQEQKKRRLLPADVLEEIGTAPSKKQKLSEDQDEEAGGSEEEEEEEGAGSDEEDDGREDKTGEMANVQNLKGNYTVTTVKERPAASSQQQAAVDFLQSRLYGAGSGRTTSNELLSLDNKRGKNKSAAVQFVKKDWASKEKAKAEKLKKRWIHKQQIPSS
ncbi:U3 small nucleolar RNA-associated protein NOL7 isoform X1 [Centroberyx gerrardi]